MPEASVPPATDVVARQRVSDPDFWLVVVCWAVVALSCLQVLLFSFGRDQTIYAVVGEGLLHGKLPYRDLWDFKPPGIFFVYALAQGLFGKTMLAPRLLEAAGMLGTVFALRSLSQAFLGVRAIGVVAGALATLFHAQFEFWHTGQPESFGGFLIVFALVLVTQQWTGRRAFLGWAGLGALFGIAFLLKPPLGGGALVCAAYLARRERVADRGIGRQFAVVATVGAGSALPILLCAAWFKARGGWEALRWTLFEFTPGYTKLGWGYATAQVQFYYGLEQIFFSFSALIGFGVIAAIAIRPVHQREREALFLSLGIISVLIAGVALQGKFFAYHYGACVPLMGFLAGLGYYKLWRRCLATGIAGVVALAVFVDVVASMRLPVRDLSPDFWERSRVRTSYFLHGAHEAGRAELDRDLYHVADFSLDGTRSAALEVQRRVPEDQPIFVWGFEPGIYWLSERRPATRYIYDVAQRATWERERSRRELMDDLRASPPAMIVVQHNDVFHFVTGDDLDSDRALATFPELSDLLDLQYAFVTKVEDFDLYERRTR